jgi:hypothetical protein
MRCFEVALCLLLSSWGFSAGRGVKGRVAPTQRRGHVLPPVNLAGTLLREDQYLYLFACPCVGLTGTLERCHLAWEVQKGRGSAAQGTWVLQGSEDLSQISRSCSMNGFFCSTRTLFLVLQVTGHSRVGKGGRGKGLRGKGGVFRHWDRSWNQGVGQEDRTWHSFLGAVGGDTRRAVSWS